MPNLFNPINPGSSMADVMNQINRNFSRLDVEAVTKVFKGAGGINAFTLGQLNDIGIGFILKDPTDIPRIACYIDANGNPVLKVSKAGYNVIETSDDNLILNSAQNTLKIVTSGTITLPGFVESGGTDTYYVDVDHGLSTLPICLAYRNLSGTYSNFTDNSGTLDQIITSGGNIVGIAQRTYAINVDATRVRFLVQITKTGTGLSNTTWPDIPIKYYLLQETVN